jgi:hypothetical protein
MANFVPPKSIRVKGSTITLRASPDNTVVTTKKQVAYEDLPEHDSPEMMLNCGKGITKAAKLGLFDQKKESIYASPQELCSFVSLYPIPESTRKTYQVPVEYFKLLQASLPSSDRSSCNLLCILITKLNSPQMYFLI